MATRVSNKLEDLRVSVAQNMFATEQVEETAEKTDAEVEVEASEEVAVEEPEVETSEEPQAE